MGLSHAVAIWEYPKDPKMQKWCNHAQLSFEPDLGQSLRKPWQKKCAIRMSLWMTDPTFGQDRVGIPMDHQLSELMLDHRKKRVKRVAKAPPAERQTNANFIQFLSDWWTRLEDVGSYSQKTSLFGVVQEWQSLGFFDLVDMIRSD